MPGLENLGIRGLGGLGIDGLEGPVPFLGFAKLKDRQREETKELVGSLKRERERLREREKEAEQAEQDRFEELQLRPGGAPLPPMPTHRPDSFVPVIETLSPEVGAKYIFPKVIFRIDSCPGASAVETVPDRRCRRRRGQGLHTRQGRGRLPGLQVHPCHRLHLRELPPARLLCRHLHLLSGELS